MKKMRFYLAALLMGLFTGLLAQDINQAGEAFNEGINFQQSEDYASAITAYEKALNISNQLGDEGVDLSMKAEQQLAFCYFNNGKTFYSNKKYNDAIENFMKSADYAKKSGEAKTEDAALTYIAGIKTAYGNNALRKDEYDKAIGYYNEAISTKPDYIKAYYGLGLVYKKQEDLPKMKEALDKVIASGNGGEKVVENAKNAAATAYLNAGALALQGGKSSEAVEYLNTSLEYNDADSKAYYYLAIGYNGLSNFDEAVNAAKKAVGLETGDKSDIYFELGKAYEGKGETSSACEAYKNVTSGANIQAAKYQVEQVLKCQ